MTDRFSHGREAYLEIDGVVYANYAKNVKYPRERKTDTVELLNNQPPAKLDGPIDGDLTFDLVAHGIPIAAALALFASNDEVEVIYGPQGNGSTMVKISNTGKFAKVDFDTDGSKAGMVSCRVSITGADDISAF